MTVDEVLRVFPHREGPWLVRAGEVILGVPPAIGQRLHPLNGTRTTPAGVRALLARDGSHEALALRLEAGLRRQPFSWREFWKRRNPVWLRVPLVPARVVRKTADLCSGLARPLNLGLLGGLGLTGYLLPRWVGPLHPGGPLDAAGLTLGILLFLVSALWHEVGHAVALKAEGYAPGGLGLGLLFILPVLFVDVTPVALLPRRGRLRVNVAGPLFQLSLAALYQIGAWMLPLPAVWAGGLRVAAASATLAVTWSLWPLIRSDGYWLVCDALDIPGLDRPLPPGAGVRTRRLVAAFRLANMGFLLVIGVILTLTMNHRLGLLDSDRLLGGGRIAVSAWGVVILAAGIWFGLVSRVLYFGRLFKSDFNLTST